MNTLTKEIQVHWTRFSPFLYIRNEAEYDQAVERLNTLVDEVGMDETHPLYSLLDTLGTVIRAYYDN